MARNSSSNTPPSNTAPTHYIVDGSNIATEGRSLPSLTQLNEAVLAFIEEHPTALITVVVDATFGHRIDKKEVKTFDDAVANNELVTPPAGAVGRGDAFVLSIAHKAKAGILSNDSFQEFHGDYPWLFDDGRLIGGKPVPHVGWVFVDRNPVRGPKSRQSLKDAKQTTSRGEGRSRVRGSGSPLAAQPMPVPSAPPPGPALAVRARRGGDDSSSVATASKVAAAAPAPGSRTAVNDLLPFLDFVERHPVGTACTVVIESYASHGAYARSGDVLVYLPLRLMGDPQPRSARTAVTIGEAISVVIVGYVPERRSIDAALPSASDAAARTVAAPAAVEPAPTKRRGRAAKPTEPAAAEVEQPVAAADVVADVVADVALTPDSRRRRKPRAQAEVTGVVPAPAEPVETPPSPAPAKRSRRAPKAQPVEVALVVDEQPAETKPAAKRTAPAKRAAAKAPAPTETAAKTVATKTPATKTPATKTPGTRTAATSTGKKVTAAPTGTKAAGKQTAAKKVAAKKTAEPSGQVSEAAPPKRTRAAKAAPKKGTAG